LAYVIFLSPRSLVLLDILFSFRVCVVLNGDDELILALLRNCFPHIGIYCIWSLCFTVTALEDQREAYCVPALTSLDFLFW